MHGTGAREQKRRCNKGKGNKRARLENTCIMYVKVLACEWCESNLNMRFEYVWQYCARFSCSMAKHL